MSVAVVAASKKSEFTGLPDFYWSKIPKRGKYTKLPQNIPNGHNTFPMVVK
jgi:hypothetical protein